MGGNVTMTATTANPTLVRTTPGSCGGGQYNVYDNSAVGVARCPLKWEYGTDAQRDYYLPRWQRYFASLDTALRTGQPAKPIDWYAMGDAWNHGTQHYATEPQGDSWSIATEVADSLHADDESQADQPVGASATRAGMTGHP